MLRAAPGAEQTQGASEASARQAEPGRLTQVSDEPDPSEISVEATGETVGEAKWKALRDLEQAAPGLDKAGVRFQVVSEGERGLLGVGFTPARVVASAPAGAAAHDRELPGRVGRRAPCARARRARRRRDRRLDAR